MTIILWCIIEIWWFLFADGINSIMICVGMRWNGSIVQTLRTLSFRVRMWRSISGACSSLEAVLSVIPNVAMSPRSPSNWPSMSTVVILNLRFEFSDFKEKSFCTNPNASCFPFNVYVSNLNSSINPRSQSTCNRPFGLFSHPSITFALVSSIGKLCSCAF